MIGLRFVSPLMVGLMCWQQGAVTTPPRKPEATAATVVEIPAGQHTFPGLVEETDADCPVAISDVASAIDYDPAREQPLWLVREELRIENRSKRAIKTVRIGTERELFQGWIASNFYVDRRLRPGQVRTEVRDQMQKFRRIRPWNGETHFVVWVIGVEFEDGSHWAASRNFRRPLTTRQFLSGVDEPIHATKFEWGANSSYKATLFVWKPGVVAYRLGVLRDTPDAFEIKTGGLVELGNAPLEEGAALTILSDDKGASLTADDLYTRPKYRLVNGAWIEAGVVLFLAEVRFADGTVWKKSSLKREDLLWNVH